MRPVAKPEATFAVVVGIERYEVNDRWSLDGPALDAVSFVEWLRSRGVPAENIRLFLSELASNKRDIQIRLAAVGVEPRAAATTSHLRTALQNDLCTVRGAELLYVYWGGHGAMQADQERRLFCEDARAGDLQPVNLDSLLKTLRSQPWSRMRHQVVVVDTCANYYEEMGYRTNQADVRFSPGDPDWSGVDQMVLLAAASGLSALNDPVRRGGEFSRRFFDLIKEAGSAEWPDFAQVAQALTREFQALAEAGESLQHPVAMRWRRSDGSGDGAGAYPVSGVLQKIAAEGGVAIPQLRSLVRFALEVSSLGERLHRDILIATFSEAVQSGVALASSDDAESDLLRVFGRALGHRAHVEALRTAIEQAEPERAAQVELFLRIDHVRIAMQLRALLSDAALSNRDLRTIYRLSAPDPTLAPAVGTLDEMIEHLQEMSVREAGELPPVIEFVERVGQKSGRGSLSEWVNDWTRGSHGGLQPAVSLRERLRREANVRKHDSATLCIDVSEAHTATTSLGPHLRYWLYGPDQRFLASDRVACNPESEGRADDAARVAFATVFQQANEILARTEEMAPLVVELFVSLEQFAWDFDEWRVYLDEPDSPTFGTSYPVTLRWVERGRSFGSALQAERRNAWRRVAQQIRGRLAEGHPPTVRWISLDGPLPSVVEATLKQGEYGTYVALQFVPGFGPASDLERRLVRAVLHGGAPFVFWRRLPPAEWSRLRTALDDHLGAGTLDEVPRLCLRLRLTAAGSADLAAPGHSLAVLWDDPDRNPLDVLLSHHAQARS